MELTIIIILSLLILFLFIGFALFYVRLTRNRDEETLKTEELTRRLTELLKEREQEANSQSARQINELLIPLRVKLDEFSSAVREAYVRDNAGRQSLADQIARLMELNMDIGREARNLTSALKGDSKVQGDWGEMVLQTLLESAGLQKDINFFTQVTTDLKGSGLRSDDGRLQRPDVIVLLPDNHKLVIDSKVSLTAYSRYCEADDKSLKDRSLREHLRSVRSHIDELAEKQYHRNIPDSAEHVMMFMPVEGAYFAAMQADSTLWKYAFDRKVVIAAPTHIFSVMQILTQLWRQEKQNRNAEQIARLGGLLYDRFASFANDFEAIERQIGQLGKAYDKCRYSLTQGPRSVVRSAERLRDLGAKTSKRIPTALGDEAEAASVYDNPSPEPPQTLDQDTDYLTK